MSHLALPCRTFKPSHSQVASIIFLGNDTFVSAHSSTILPSSVVYIWSFSCETPLKTITCGDTNKILCLCRVSPTTFLSGSMFGIIHLWDLENEDDEPIKTFIDEPFRIESLCLQKKGYFVSGSVYGKTILWSFDSDIPISSMKDGTCAHALHSFVDGSILACFPRHAKHLDLERREALQTFRKDGAIFRSMEVLSDGTFLLGGRTTIDRFDIKSGKCIQNFLFPESVHILSLLALDTKFFLAATSDGHIFLWDLRSGEIIQTFEAGGTTNVHDLCLLPDDTFLSQSGASIHRWTTPLFLQRKEVAKEKSKVFAELDEFAYLPPSEGFPGGPRFKEAERIWNTRKAKK